MGNVESREKYNSLALSIDTSAFECGSLNENIMWEHDRKAKVFSSYEMVRVLGEGSMGTISCIQKKSSKDSKPLLKSSNVSMGSVSRAMKTQSSAINRAENGSNGNQLYACKAIPLARLSNPRYLDVLRNEIAIMKSLDHPNILRAIETFETKKQIFIVMEYCSGGDLYVRTPYSEANCVLIIQKVLSALSYLHSKNIIHRDVKYENIMFSDMSPDADIKLIDFGLAKKFLPGEILQARAGSMYTMAPEVFDRSGYTAKADMWSLGVVAYMMLSNEKPYVTPHYVKDCPFKFDEPLWANTSAEAKAFVSSLMQKDTVERLSAHEAAKSAWLTQTKASQPKMRNPIKVPIEKLTTDLATYSCYNELTKIALMLIARRWSLDNINDLNDVFRLYDKTNDGILSIDEFCDALRLNGYEEKEIKSILPSVVCNFCLSHSETIRCIVLP
mmetsp:Transcript_17345/g.39163  ORF Transcript_17345/g.39163 Transcript_17345/m.39163 type:complete len:444 (-) Transcript_17345:850-2181(-)